MKKSQVLAALALAFALGVAVIPTADTYAAIVKVDDKGAEVIDETLTEKVEKAIEAGKESCGWHLDGTTKAWYYDEFLALSNALKAAEGKLEDQEKFNFDGTGTDAAGNNTESLKQAYAESIVKLKSVVTDAGLTLPTSIKEEFTSDVTNYSEAVVFINNARKEMATQSTRYSSNPTVAEAYRNIAIDLEKALKAAADDIENVSEWASDHLIQPAINKITEATSINTNLTYAQAVAEANNLSVNNNGTCSITKAQNIEKAVTYAENMINSQNSFYAADAEKAIAAIVKAQNGGTITDIDTPNKPNDGTGNDQNKAPNTGALTNAEGSASTTVAMVAGIATALTAAGAGVVAYRNARRSTRK